MTWSFKALIDDCLQSTLSCSGTLLCKDSCSSQKGFLTSQTDPFGLCTVCWAEIWADYMWKWYAACDGVGRTDYHFHHSNTDKQTATREGLMFEWNQYFWIIFWWRKQQDCTELKCGSAQTNIFGLISPLEYSGNTEAKPGGHMAHLVKETQNQHLLRPRTCDTRHTNTPWGEDNRRYILTHYAQMWYVKMVQGELGTETREQMTQTKLWELKTPPDDPHPCGNLHGSWSCTVGVHPVT